jgi:hapalindole-type alkaloid chlorinase
MSTVSVAPLLTLHPEQLHEHPRLLLQMLDGQILGVIIKRAFSPAFLEQLRQTLEHSSTIGRIAIEHYQGWQYGRTLVISKPDLQEYFTEAKRLRTTLQTAGLHFEQQLLEQLTVIAAGLPISPPLGPYQDPYGLSTVRIVQPGGEIHLHCENETAHFAPVSHLASVLDLRSQLSFYAPLALPEGGGQLHIYHVRHGEASGAPLRSMNRSDASTLQYVEQYGFTLALPEVGDLLIFDAGRHYHRVSAITGTHPRWTMGGFIARARQQQSLHYWS